MGLWITTEKYGEPAVSCWNIFVFTGFQIHPSATHRVCACAIVFGIKTTEQKVNRVVGLVEIVICTFCSNEFWRQNGCPVSFFVLPNQWLFFSATKKHDWQRVITSSWCSVPNNSPKTPWQRQWLTQVYKTRINRNQPVTWCSRHEQISLQFDVNSALIFLCLNICF